MLAASVSPEHAAEAVILETTSAAQAELEAQRAYHLPPESSAVSVLVTHEAARTPSASTRSHTTMSSEKAIVSRVLAESRLAPPADEGDAMVMQWPRPLSSAPESTEPGRGSQAKSARSVPGHSSFASHDVAPQARSDRSSALLRSRSLARMPPSAVSSRRGAQGADVAMCVQGTARSGAPRLPAVRAGDRVAGVRVARTQSASSSFDAWQSIAEPASPIGHAGENLANADFGGGSSPRPQTSEASVSGAQHESHRGTSRGHAAENLTDAADVSERPLPASTGQGAPYASLETIDAAPLGAVLALPATSVLALHTATQISEAIAALRLARAAGTDISGLTLSSDLRSALSALRGGMLPSEFAAEPDVLQLLQEVGALTSATTSRRDERRLLPHAATQSDVATSAVLTDASAAFATDDLGDDAFSHLGAGNPSLSANPPVLPAMPPYSEALSGGPASRLDFSAATARIRHIDEESASLSSDYAESDIQPRGESNSDPGEIAKRDALFALAMPAVDYADVLGLHREKPLTPKAQRALSASRSPKAAASAAVFTTPGLVAPVSPRRALQSRGGAGAASVSSSLGRVTSLAAAAARGSPGLVGNLLRQASYSSRRAPIVRTSSRSVLQPPPDVVAAEREALEVRSEQGDRLSCCTSILFVRVPFRRRLKLFVQRRRAAPLR